MTQHAVNHRLKKAGVAKSCGFHAACRDVKTIISSIIKLAKEPRTNMSCQGTDGSNKWIVFFWCLLSYQNLSTFIVH